MDTMTVLQNKRDSVDIRIDLNLDSFRDHWRSNKYSGILVKLSACCTYSHISVSPREIETSLLLSFRVISLCSESGSPGMLGFLIARSDVRGV